VELKSFGGLKRSVVEINAPTTVTEASNLMLGQPYLSVGNNKSYGDVGLVSEAKVLSTFHLNRIVSFDEELGTLVCESGVLLRDIQSFGVEQGWMLQVTPGTSLVTVGGAIANDVHGKDHHFAGTFGHHVLEILLVRSNGEVLVCSESQNADLFQATIGGLGLTGFIAQAKLQLKRVVGPYLETENLEFGNLSEFFEISKESAENWQANVAWFDCSTSKSGRGIFSRGNPSDRQNPRAESRKAALTIPKLPLSLVNPATLDVFNTTYFKAQRRALGKGFSHYENFYYPLDRIKNWNRIYGPKGFFQFQSVVPPVNAVAASEEILNAIKLSGEGSFLAVLKVFGSKPGAGLLSFAREGVTLALDFPNRGENTLRLFETLHSIVLEAGGAMNPSKDALMSRELFQSGFPRISEFANHRDPMCVSDFSRRLID
jgi:FAD/FMN-containing dehydrogenase